MLGIGMEKSYLAVCILVISLLLTTTVSLTFAMPIKLTDNNAADIQPDWSPDGSKIAFSSNRSGSYDIWVMNSDGTNQVRLTSNLSYDGSPDDEYWPTWSSDGNKIAFFVKNNTGPSYTWEVWIMDVDGSNKQKLFTVDPWSYKTPDLTGFGKPLDFAWSPDNTKLLFHGFPAEGGNIELFVYDLASKTFTMIDPQGEDNPCGYVYGLSWNTKNEIAYDRYPCGIYVFNFTGNTTPLVHLLVKSNELESGRVATEPDWSDGDFLAFFNMSVMENATNQICVYDVTESKVIFTYDLGAIEEWSVQTSVNPAISPDGSKVAFAMKDEDGDMEIYIVNVAAISNYPTASFTYTPNWPVSGQVITFNASSSYDPDGYIVNYTWNFGDGCKETTTSPIAHHSYSAAGTYTVTLTVTDNDGLASSTSKQITVLSGTKVTVDSVTTSMGQFNVNVSITNVTNLAGFQFDINYISSIIY